MLCHHDLARLQPPGGAYNESDIWEASFHLHCVTTHYNGSGLVVLLHSGKSKNRESKGKIMQVLLCDYSKGMSTLVETSILLVLLPVLFIFGVILLCGHPHFSGHHYFCGRLT